MSANLDSIDLNSDVLSGEPENDIKGFNNVSEVRTKVGLSSDAEALIDSGKNGEGQKQEAVIDQVQDFKGDYDLKEVAGGGIGREGKMDSADKSVDLEGENGSGSGVDDGSAQEVEVAETTVAHSRKVEGESSFKIEEEVKEGGCGVASSSSVGEDDNQVKSADVKVKVDNANDLSPHKEPGNVSPKISSEAVESQVMEIDDERGKDSESENEDAAAFDEGVLQENENLESNESNLVVDVVADGNATGDVNTKMASKEVGLSVGDLVWGKVRSHPWWPGQVFGRSDASKKAKKYFKKNCYLIAYFGDQTFAWNEVSKIKPFRCNFSLLEKQSNLEDFHDAVHCALDEVSRRVEFGLACPCMPGYSKIKTQIIVNPGIREESCRRDGGDSFSNAACFEPPKLIEYVKELGQLLLGGINILEFVTARSQLLVFNRWKGYSHLPEFQILGELLESDAEISQSAEVKHGNEMVENTATKVKDESVSSGKEKPKSADHSSRKRKHISGDKEHPSKKEKSLADLIAERRSSAAKAKCSLDGEATGKTTTSSSGKKRKAVKSISDDSMMKQSKSPSSSGVDNGSSQPKKTYRVGESILRVASQLNGSTPILKSVNGKSVNTTSRKNAKKTKSQEKSTSGKSKASPDELMSQLCLVARDPMKGCNFLKSVVSFFVKFRNSVCINPLNSQQHVQSSLEHISGGDVGELSTIVETRTTDLEHMKDSHWTDKMTQSNPKGQSSHENKNEAREIPEETPTKDGIPTFRKQSAVQLEPNLECELHIAGGILDLGAGKPIDHLEGKRNDDSSPCPTALILNFTDLDAVPSETNLNRIFSRFGPLKETETQVLKKSKRAKVVFCRSADAETAFSSAGKYSVFGPSLVSYRLKYITSTNCKSSPNATKRSEKDASSTEGIAIDASSSHSLEADPK
ncbi:PWWP domain-containing protein 5 [Populus nigra]|uniref:PWWP domain-containing protein 5 n=1 Tax=Populus nigra TaxID=3691 RepID=UPI002B271A6C|nr:PWWP domain-containing protein 5 [Populus nigra]